MRNLAKFYVGFPLNRTGSIYSISIKTLSNIKKSLSVVNNVAFRIEAVEAIQRSLSPMLFDDSPAANLDSHVNKKS
jgi:hypothetical protein